MLLRISSGLKVKGYYWQQLPLRELALGPKNELVGLRGPVSEQGVGEDLLALHRCCMKLEAKLLDAKSYRRLDRIRFHVKEWLTMYVSQLPP